MKNFVNWLLKKNANPLEEITKLIFKVGLLLLFIVVFYASLYYGGFLGALIYITIGFFSPAVVVYWKSKND